MTKKKKVANQASPMDIVRMVDKAVDYGDDTELRAYLASLPSQTTKPADEPEEVWEQPEAAG